MTNLELEALRRHYQELIQKLGTPELLSRPEEFAQASRRVKELLEEIGAAERELRKSQRRVEAERILRESTDSELRELAEQELVTLGKEVTQDPRTGGKKERVLLEIRPGTGGDEAALFAYELTRMYRLFAERNNMSVAVLDESLSDLGGVKSITLSVTGPNATLLLANEAGVHRVQRTPVTEKAGRIHTSTVTVVVLAAPEEKEIEIRPQDLRIDTMRASGPGGQFVNRRESAVRIVHLSTGILVASQTARSQLANKEQAMQILRAKLSLMEKEKNAKEKGALRRSQIGTGERADKIRTYNFPQDRITDHRIKKSWHNIAKIMDGDITPMLEALQSAQTPMSKSK